jgi:Domain of unknown function (DUF4190)
MTEPLDTPSGGREKPEGTPESASPYPYPPPYPQHHQPGPSPGGYPSPALYYGYPPPPVAPKNGVGIASLVLAIVALLSVWTVFVAVVLGPAAVVVGIIGRGRVKRGTANNDGVAIAGIALGALAIIVGVAFIPIYTVVWKDVGGGDYIDCIQKADNDRLEQQRCADQFRQNVQDKLSVTLTPARVP